MAGGQHASKASVMAGASSPLKAGRHAVKRSGSGVASDPSSYGPQCAFSYDGNTWIEAGAGAKGDVVGPLAHEPGWDFYDVVTCTDMSTTELGTSRGTKLRVRREAPIRLVRVFCRWPSDEPPIATSLRPEGVQLAELVLPPSIAQLPRILVAVCPPAAASSATVVQESAADADQSFPEFGGQAVAAMPRQQDSRSGSMSTRNVTVAAAASLAATEVDVPVLNGQANVAAPLARFRQPRAYSVHLADGGRHHIGDALQRVEAKLASCDTTNRPVHPPDREQDISSGSPSRSQRNSVGAAPSNRRRNTWIAVSSTTSRSNATASETAIEVAEDSSRRDIVIVAELKKEVAELAIQIEEQRLAARLAEEESLRARGHANSFRVERDELLQRLRCAERTTMASDMQVRNLTSELAEARKNQCNRYRRFSSGGSPTSCCSCDLGSPMAATPTSFDDIVANLVSFEIKQLGACAPQDRAGLKRKLLLRWHPDKNGGGTGSLTGACSDLATRVVQEMQGRPEWAL